MHDDVGLQHLFQRGAERRDQFDRQIGDKAHRVGEDHLAPVRQHQSAHGGIERREQQVLGEHVRFRQRVEQRRLAGIGVAHQRHDRIRHALARFAMQPARALHLFQFLADFREPFADQPAVGFDLRFAGAAQEAEAAALTFEMGPAAHQPAALIGQMGEFDLQTAFPGLRAFAEDFENERGAVEHLGSPRPFEIALLHGAQMRVDDDHFRFERARLGGDLFDLAGADQRGGTADRQRHDPLRNDFEPDGRGQADAFRKPRLCVTVEAIVGRMARFRLDMNDKRRASMRAVSPRCAIGALQAVSSAAGSTS